MRPLTTVSEAVKVSATAAAQRSAAERVRMDVLEWTPALRKRYAEMMHTARYNLNGSHDNAIAEALALARLFPGSHTVLPERELLRCQGFGQELCGTPDGAVILASGGMAAVQVVRAAAPRGPEGVAALLRVSLGKVHKSLRWLLESGLGASVCSFAIAIWLPRRLSCKALAALRGALCACAGWLALDPRFEVVLLVPPPRFRTAIFTREFGKVHARAAVVAAAVETTQQQRPDAHADGQGGGAARRAMVSDICAFSDAWRSGGGGAATAATETDIGMLADIMAAED